MTKRIKISVSQPYIDTGMVGSCGFCPVASAINDTITGKCVVGFKDIVYWTHWGKWYPLKSPRSVCDFVRAFDAGKEVQPFKFFLELPE